MSLISNFCTNYRLLIIIVISSFLCGCTTIGLGLINTQARLKTNNNVTKDIRYGQQSWQKMDIYVPAQSPTNSYPTLIFFYGGGWNSGHKEQYYFAASRFTDLGYLVAVPDYVKYPQGKFPTFIEDGAQAIAWVRNNIESYGGNPDNIFIVGHSAGAHLGALLLADSSYLQKVGLSTKDIRAFAGLAGPYNFTPTEPRFVRIFEPPSNYPKMQIVNYISGDEPPMLLMHGTKDTLVSVTNKDSTLAAINAAGGISKGIDYPKSSHVRLLLGLTSPLIGNADPSTDINAFFRPYLTQ